MSNHEEPLRTTMRFAVNDLKKTLSTIGSVRDGDTELRFENGRLLVRSEDSSGLARQAPVLLLESAGPRVGFRVSNEKLPALSRLGRELKMSVVARD